jgi:hypothetical protein
MLIEPATNALEPYHIQLLFVMSSDFKDTAICHPEKKPWSRAEMFYTQVAVKEEKPTPAQDMIICAGGWDTASRIDNPASLDPHAMMAWA